MMAAAPLGFVPQTPCSPTHSSPSLHCSWTRKSASVSGVPSKQTPVAPWSAACIIHSSSRRAEKCSASFSG